MILGASSGHESCGGSSQPMETSSKRLYSRIDFVSQRFFVLILQGDSLSLSLSLSLPPSLSFSPSPSVFIPASAPLSLSPFFSNYNSPPTTGCHSTRGNLKRRRKRRRTKKKEKKEGNKEGQIREVTCLVAMLAHLPPDGRYSHYSSFLHYTSISGFYSLAYPADSQAFLAATVIGLDSGETSTCYQQLIIHGGEKYAN